MFIEFTDVLNESKVIVNKENILCVRPRKEVEFHSLSNVTEIETSTTKIFVKESYEQIKSQLLK